MPMSLAAGEHPIVHVVDDDSGVRRALSTLLQAAGHVVRTYESADQFLAARPGLSPGCALLDLQMPGQGGFEVQKALSASGEPLPVVFLTAHGDIPQSVRALKAGAVDFLTKPVKRTTLLAAVDTALARDAERRGEREAVRALRSRYATLTHREREVFALVVAGRLNKQTGADLGIAERTVKIHRARVMEKMRAGSLAELVHAAEQLGLGLAGRFPPPQD